MEPENKGEEGKVEKKCLFVGLVSLDVLVLQDHTPGFFELAEIPGSAVAKLFN